MDKRAAISESQDLIDFIDKCPTSHFVVDNFRQMLINDGFTELDMRDEWQIVRNGKYFVTYNGTSIIAFRGNDTIGEHDNDSRSSLGFRMVASHSDSPTFRIKPCGSSVICRSMNRLSTETYGGAILYSWLDRPISLAGRALVATSDPLNPKSILVDFKKPIGVIPSVAIHFNRSINEGAAFNKQVDMQILTQASSLLGAEDIPGAICSQIGIDRPDLLDYDLYAYDPTPGCIAGFDDSLMICPKQDNLTMAYESYRAFIDAIDSGNSMMFIVLDNEEVGSGTKQGAASPLVKNVIERYCYASNLSSQDVQRVIYNSFLVSADMAHAVHPNHPDLSDPANLPALNGGPVIKYNASQKYMTDADGAAVFKTACQRAGVPCQTFVNRSDMAGGSTLGNIMTSQLPLRGVDVGNPLLGMHSSRETGGSLDPLYLRKALREFYAMR